MIPIALPALRDRREDIPLIVEHFLVKYAELMQKSVASVSHAATISGFVCAAAAGAAQTMSATR